MEYLRRLAGRASRQRHRLQIVQDAMRPSGAAARLFIRAGLSAALRARWRRRGGYARWIALYDELTQDDRTEIVRRIAGETLPTINLIWPLGPDDRPDDVVRLVRSLQAQMLCTWTLSVLAPTDGASLPADVLADARIHVERWTRGERLPGLPRERLLLLLSPGVLRKHSLFTFALAAAAGTDVAYCDSDRIDGRGVRTSPAFRPAFSPELARQTNCFGPCIYLASSARLAGVDIGSELEVSRAIAGSEPARVMHLPLVLFHETTERAAKVAPHVSGEAVRSVSIIIPTRDRLDLLSRCVESIRARTDYPADRIEIVIVDNGSIDANTLDYLRALASQPNVQVIRDDSPFNYSRLNNLAVRRAKGDVLVLLNNDILIDDPHWLHRLVVHAAKPDVGAVGGKLLYPDRTVQHAGVILGVGGGARHAQLYAAEQAEGYLGFGRLDREMSAVTGACLAMRRELFDALGGLDEDLAISFNDVTLCAKAQRRGFRNICVATPLAIHFESKSRGFDDTPEKVILARNELIRAVSEFRELFRRDPFYSPNLSADGAYAIAFPPRVAKPWRRLKLEAGRKLRILLVGEVRLGAAIGDSLRAQARDLAARGHDVVTGGSSSPWSSKDDRLRHVRLRGPDSAAEFAIRGGIDCVVVHSSPFFSIARWLGDAARLVAVDHAAETDAPAAIVEHNRFWKAWADGTLTVRAGEASSDIVALIESLCAR